jgi:YfiH family protein
MVNAPRFLTAPNLAECPSIRHAFFTREGGVSEGIYASLNTGFGSGDDAAAVAENRRRAAAALRVPEDALNTVYQVHGNAVAPVEAPWSRESAPRADAMVTRSAGVALGILTADCVPVLFADAAAGVIGAAHAGWKGALSGVLRATVDAMEALGASRAAIGVGVGPAIAQESYEVGPEFPAPFLAEDPGNATYFIGSARPGHFMFDLPGYVADVLARLNVGAVDSLDLDTCGDPERFFSYRRSTHRSEADYGRCLSAITLLP